VEYRAIGNTDLYPSVLGLGTSKLTSVSSGLTRSEALDLIATAADHGINFIDTADIYGQGDSEAVIGEAIRGRRNRFIVATKIGYRFSDTGGLLIKAMPLIKRALRPFKRARALVAAARNNAQAVNVIRQDFSPAYLVEAIDNSLRRLRTDYLDVLYLHDVPPLFELSDELIESLARVQSLGKVRFFGIAAAHAESLEIACSNPILRLVQTEVHPLRPTSVFAPLETARKGVVVNRIFSRGQEQTLNAFAQRYDITPRQVLLGFAVRQSFVSSVLTGTTNCKHLKENIASIISAKNFPYDELVQR